MEPPPKYLINMMEGKQNILKLAITVMIIITVILLERVRIIEWNITTQFSDTLAERGKQT